MFKIVQLQSTVVTTILAEARTDFSLVEETYN